MRICSLVFNNFAPDVRVLKEAQTLAEAGHDVMIVCLAATGRPNVEWFGRVKVVRVNLSGASARPGRATAVGQQLRNWIHQAAIAIVAVPWAVGSAISRSSATEKLHRSYRAARVWGRRNRRHWLVHGSKPVRVTLFWMGRIERVALRRLRRYTRFAARRGSAFMRRASRWSTARYRQSHRYFLGACRRICPAAFKVWQQRVFARATYDEMVEFQPNVIHSHDLTTLYAGVRNSRRLAARLVYDAHEMEWESNRIHGTFLTKILWRLQEAALIRLAERVVTVSPRIAEMYRIRYRLLPPVVVPNVPYHSELTGPATGTASCDFDLRQAIPDGLSKRIVLCLGNVAPHRGIEQAIESLGMLETEFVLATVGNATPAYAAKLDRLAIRLGVADRFFRFPAVPYEAVVSTAQAADIGAVLVQQAGASYRYCMPNKLFELMHSGVPMVVGDLPDVAAVVAANEIGVACDQTSPASIAGAIRTVVDARTRLRPDETRLAQIRAHYCWEAFAPRLLRAYDELVASPRKRRHRGELLRNYLRHEVWRTVLGKSHYEIDDPNCTGLAPADYDAVREQPGTVMNQWHLKETCPATRGEGIASGQRAA